MAQHYGDVQNAIYERGLAGERPRVPVGFDDLEAAAERVMDPRAFAYVAGAAGREATARANLAAFDRWRIVPRMLRGVTRRDLTTSVCGIDLPAPLLIAPIGALAIVHPLADRAVAAAAAATGVPMCVSTAASTPMEDVAKALGDTPGLYQLYWPNDRDLATSFVHRAEAAGYRAIVLTLDTWALGWRPRDITTAYLPFLRGISIDNYVSDPAFRALLPGPPEEDPIATARTWARVFGNPTLTWDDLGWLAGLTELPILLKGICHPDDARAAVDAGVAGLVVSNHGGRQVDGAIAALDALPGVVEAAGDLPVLFDSGVRSGADVVKALALGARAVLLGRPWVYGLGLAGAAGVEEVVRAFLADTELTLALSGCGSVSDIGAELLSSAP